MLEGPNLYWTDLYTNTHLRSIFVRDKNASLLSRSIISTQYCPGQIAVLSYDSLRVMSLLVLRRPWSALLASPQRYFALAPSGCPGLCATASIVVVGPPPEWTAATLAAGQSPLVMVIAGLRAASLGQPC